MASYKIRRKTLITGGEQIGTGGTLIGEILTGSVAIICSSALGHGAGLATTATVTGLDAAAMLFVTCGSMDANMALKTAKATANTITVNWSNAGSAAVSGSTLITLQYVAFTPA